MCSHSRRRRTPGPGLSTQLQGCSIGLACMRCGADSRCSFSIAAAFTPGTLVRVRDNLQRSIARSRTRSRREGFTVWLLLFVNWAIGTSTMPPGLRKEAGTNSRDRPMVPKLGRLAARLWLRQERSSRPRMLGARLGHQRSAQYGAAHRGAHADFRMRPYFAIERPKLSSRISLMFDAASGFGRN